MGDDHDVYLIESIACCLQPFGQKPGIRSCADTVAGIEKHDFIAGVDDHRRKVDLQLFAGQMIGFREFRHFFRRLINAENLKRLACQPDAVIDRGYLKASNPVSMVRRFRYAKQRGLGETPGGETLDIDKATVPVRKMRRLTLRLVACIGFLLI